MIGRIIKKRVEKKIDKKSKESEKKTDKKFEKLEKKIDKLEEKLKKGSSGGGGHSAPPQAPAPQAAPAAPAAPAPQIQPVIIQGGYGGSGAFGALNNPGLGAFDTGFGLFDGLASNTNLNFGGTGCMNNNFARPMVQSPASGLYASFQASMGLF